MSQTKSFIGLLKQDTKAVIGIVVGHDLSNKHRVSLNRRILTVGTNIGTVPIGSRVFMEQSPGRRWYITSSLGTSTTGAAKEILIDG